MQFCIIKFYVTVSTLGFTLKEKLNLGHLLHTSIDESLPFYESDGNPNFLSEGTICTNQQISDHNSESLSSSKKRKKKISV